MSNLPIHFFTIVLNGEPFIRHHIDVFAKLHCEWHWHIVEGVAELTHDTAWSVGNGGRITGGLHRNGLSNDGTSHYLDELAAAYPERVSLYRKRGGAFWDGKLEMVSAPLAGITEEALLWQVDADEFWTAEQIQTARDAFLAEPQKTAAFYFCRFYVGPGLVISTRDTYGNHSSYEWLRTWRYRPGDRWVSHEPPRLCRQRDDGSWIDLGRTNPLLHAETERMGLVFRHYAYVVEEQLRFKEIYYGYRDALRGWQLLQQVRTFPAPLRDYFPWVQDGALVKREEDVVSVPCSGSRRSDDPVTGEVSSIIFLRPDSIGDNVLAASILPHLKARYPQAAITVLCQQHIAELYEASPLVHSVITFDLRRAYLDEDHRETVFARLQRVQADLLVNSLYSRHQLYDIFAITSGARNRIALHGDLSNIEAEARDHYNRYYTSIIPSPGDLKSELERHGDLLKGMGIIVQQKLGPVFWLTESDEQFAARFFEENGLAPERCIALFAGAQSELRTYAHYGKALAAICREGGYTVLALGAQADRELNQHNLDDCRAPGINLSGKLTLRQTAAILKRCRLAVGTETGTAHIACAVGTPNVILVGGGHFGRFMPYSPLTSVVCLPLACYFCNWTCGYRRAHCVKDIHPDVIAEAITQTLEQGSDTIRIFQEADSLWRPLPEEPSWKWRGELLGDYPCQVIEVASRTSSKPAALASSAKPVLRIAGKSPRLSLVIPSYNYGHYLGDCLDSILSQNYPNLELIVLDGGSSDGTVDIIRKHERYISFWRSHRDAGQYAAIEEGLNRSTGEIMTWLNADDMFHPGAFETASTIFSESPEVEWLMGRPNSFDEQGRQKVVMSFLPLNSRAKYLAGDETIQQEGSFWRRGLWQRSGAFIDKTLPLAADLELWARFFRSARLFSVDTLLAGFRDHPLQKSKDKAGYTAEANRVLAREREIFAAESKRFSPPAPLPILIGTPAAAATASGARDRTAMGAAV